MDHFKHKRLYVPRRASEVIALVALSTTLFLFLHTSQLRERLRVAQQSAPASASAPSMHQQETMVAATPGVYPSSQANYGTSRLVSAIVQPSLELLNDQEDVRTLNITGRAGQQLVFFNRVPKVGSQTLMELIRRLAQRNAFAFHRDRVQRVETIRLAPDDEERLAQMVSNLEAPGVYVKHVCYTNFTKYGFPEPIYMNIVRDPVERVISWYYYIRAPWYYVERKRAFPDLPLPDPNWLKKDFETCVLRGDRECRYIEGETREGIGDHRRQSLFFCGHDEECTPFNTAEALARAKAAVERHYAVVGVLEELNVTLSVLERYMPRFFAGASDIYWGEGVNSINRNLYKPPVSEAIKDIVRANFTRETEFYQFCKQRLHRQYRALNLV